MSGQDTGSSGAATAPAALPDRTPDRHAPLFGMPASVLAALFVAIALAPVGLALLDEGPPANVWREFSGALALIAFAIILMQFLLSGRFTFVSGRAGIDLTMRLHQLAARTALAFLILHPLLYAGPRLASGDLPGSFSILQGMFLSERLRTGVLAWLLMIALVAMAIWRDRLPIRYEAWRLTHGLGALAIAALGLHHTVTAGSYSSVPILSGFWYILAAIAVGSLLWVYLVRPLQKMRDPWRITEIAPAAERTWRVVITPESGRSLPYRAGQFFWLNLGHSPFSLTEHPFSIASAPSSGPDLEFIVKESGDFTSQLGSVPTGIPAYIDGPHGSFCLAGHAPCPIVLIAGGVGIAPILSILRDLAHDGYDHPVTLIYGNRAATQIVARDEIEAMERTLDLSTHFVLSEPPPDWQGAAGELTRDVLSTCIGQPDQRALFFVCGPPAMLDAVESALLALGAPPARIVSERFKYD